MMNARMATLFLSGALSLGASVASAATPVPPSSPAPSALAGACCPPSPRVCPPGSACPSVSCLPSGCETGLGLRFELDAEFLLWWLRSSALPPLATTSQPQDLAHLGAPTTRVLLGDNFLSQNPIPGGRFAARVFTDDGIGWGVGGFFLDQTSQTTQVSGVPYLAAPAIDPSTGSPYSIPLAIPSFASGFASVELTSKLWGIDTNLYWRAFDDDNCRLDLFGGFRFLQLDELLRYSTTTTLDRFNSGVDGYDAFDTQNDFYGGQIGARFQALFHRLILNLQGQIALGGTCAGLDIRGANSFRALDGSVSVEPGNIYSQSTNLGRHSRNLLTFVPQLGASVGYQCCECCTLQVGYDFLYWSRVVRPGDQIDLQVNPTAFGGAPTGPARPTGLLDTTDFWAQGVTFSLLFSF